MDPITVIGLVASVVVSWYLIREVGGWFYGVIRQNLWGKLLPLLAVILWMVSQVIILKVLQSPRQEVGVKIPNRFAVLVITPGEGDEKYEAQIIFYDGLVKFINGNPEYTYLVPEGLEGHLNKMLVDSDPSSDGSVRVERLLSGGQSLEVTLRLGENRFTGWYDASDKEIFPRYYKFTHNFAVFMVWFPYLMISTLIIYVFYKIVNQKIGSQQRPNKQDQPRVN